MRKAFWHTELIIDTQHFYPAHELFELMGKKLEGKFGAFSSKKILGVEYIYAQGMDGYRIEVLSRRPVLGGKRGVIIISQGKPLKEMFKETFKITAKDIQWIILYIVTLGLAWIVRRISWVIAGIFNLEGTKENRAIMRSLGEEIEKLVNQ
jgi:hypothetical protein